MVDCYLDCYVDCYLDCYVDCYLDCYLDFSSLEIQFGDLFLDEVCFFGSSVFSYFG